MAGNLGRNKDEPDEQKSLWTIDFLLGQSIPDQTLHHLISTLPLPRNNNRLNKKILLRHLSSQIQNTCSISKSTLETLELIEEIDSITQTQTLDSIKQAYAAVATECTVKCLRDHGGDEYRSEFKKVVLGFWRGRVVEMEKFQGEVGLMSDRLLAARDEIEAAVWNVTVRTQLLARDTRGDAVRCVRVYLEEASVAVGLSFLELAAAEVSDGGCGMTDVRSVKEVRKKAASVETPEVRRVQEALKKSCLALHGAVSDPLPEALRVAESLAQDGEGDSRAHGGLGRPSLMDRNVTARTFEWDDADSVNSSSGQSRDPPRLPMPKNNKHSPLKHETRKNTGKRMHKKWSSLEEQTLINAVEEHGRGNWKRILESYQEIFEDRTAVDLKDKWRNMNK